MADSAYNFLPLNTTAPGFTSVVSTTGSVFRLETSSTTARIWGSPTNRFVRITSVGGDDLWMSFGSTAAADLPVVGSHPLLLMPDTHIFPVLAKNLGISFLTTTAGSSVSVTLGTIVQY